MISCIAVIGRQASPLYLKTFEGSIYSDTQLTEMLYLCCDIFQERMLQKTYLDNYFGFLTALNGIVFYGSISNTRVKFVIALQAEPRQPRDSRLRSTLQKVQLEYSKVGRCYLVLSVVSF